MSDFVGKLKTKGCITGNWYFTFELNLGENIYDAFIIWSILFLGIHPIFPQWPALANADSLD